MQGNDEKESIIKDQAKRIVKNQAKKVAKKALKKLAKVAMKAVAKAIALGAKALLSLLATIGLPAILIIGSILIVIVLANSILSIGFSGKGGDNVDPDIKAVQTYIATKVNAEKGKYDSSLQPYIVTSDLISSMLPLMIGMADINVSDAKKKVDQIIKDLKPKSHSESFPVKVEITKNVCTWEEQPNWKVNGVSATFFEVSNKVSVLAFGWGGPVLDPGVPVTPPSPKPPPSKPKPPEPPKETEPPPPAPKIKVCNESKETKEETVNLVTKIDAWNGTITKEYSKSWTTWSCTKKETSEKETETCQRKETYRHISDNLSHNFTVFDNILNTYNIDLEQKKLMESSYEAVTSLPLGYLSWLGVSPGSNGNSGGNTGGSGPITIKPGDIPPASDGVFMKPANGRLSSPFGMRWGRLHSGIDIASGGKNVPIYAAADGVVTVSEYQWKNGKSTYGERIIIQHNINGKIWTTCYWHMVEGSRQFKVGDKVKKGDVIGLMGKTGDSTGIHLHFEIHPSVRVGESQRSAVDPLLHIKL